MTFSEQAACSVQQPLRFLAKQSDKCILNALKMEASNLIFIPSVRECLLLTDRHSSGDRELIDGGFLHYPFSC